MKLTKADIKEYKSKSDDFGVIKTKLEDRITEILKLVRKIFNNESGMLDNWSWWFSGAQPGETGEIDIYIINRLIDEKDIKDVYIEYVYESYSKNCKSICTKNYALDYSFPAEWLLWENEKIGKFIHNEIKKDEEESKKKKACQKRSKDSLIKKALKKLTKEEKKALGIK